jgi:DNA-binding PadR family transcriptional regulator
MKMKLHRLTGFARDMLFVIAGMDAHTPSGSEIKKKMNSISSAGVSEARIYQNLSSLEERGFISVSSIDGRTNGYALTQQAVDAINDHIDWQLTRSPTSHSSSEVEDHRPQ